MKVRWIGPFAQKTGYAQAGHDYLMALQSQGVDLDIVPIVDCDTDDLDPRYAALLPLVNRTSFEPTHVVIHTIPKYCAEFLTEGSHKNIAMTTWECNRVLNEDQKSLGVFDAVLVPALHNKHAFSEGFVAQVIPHCADLDFWCAKRPLRPASRPYTFLSVLSWNGRKNPIGLLTAYFAEFSGKEDVVLNIHSPSVSQEDVGALLAAMGVPNPPRVVFSSMHLSMEGMRDLHHGADCYVSATRGEGWGLGMFESVLVGNPLIATDWSGHKDFAKLASWYLPVEYQLTPAVVPDGAALGLRGDLLWAEPGLYSLMKQMRLAYNSRYLYQKQPDLRLARYSYENVGEQFVKFLTSL